MTENKIIGFVGNLAGNKFDVHNLNDIESNDLKLILDEINRRKFSEKHRQKMDKYKTAILDILNNIKEPLSIKDKKIKPKQRLILFDIENIGVDDLKFVKNLSVFDTLVVMYHKGSSTKNFRECLDNLDSPCKMIYKELDVEGKQVVDFRYYGICTSMSQLYKDLNIFIISKDGGFNIFKEVNKLNITILSSLSYLRCTEFITPTYKDLDLLSCMIPPSIATELSDNIDRYVLDKASSDLINITKRELVRAIVSRVKLSDNQILDICDLSGFDTNIKSDYSPIDNQELIESLQEEISKLKQSLVSKEERIIELENKITESYTELSKEELDENILIKDSSMNDFYNNLNVSLNKDIIFPNI